MLGQSKRLLRCIPSCQQLIVADACIASEVASGSRGFANLALINKGVKHGPGGRSSISGVTATVFGATGFLGRYVVNALARQGSQIVLPYRCDDLEAMFLKPMGDLGQMVLQRGFDIRDEDQIKHLVSKSNVVINLLGIEKETWNYTFEDVHVDAAGAIARAAAANGILERFMHVSALGASDLAASRRLRTKAAGDALVREAIPESTIFQPAQMVGVEDRLLNNWAGLAKLFPFIPLIDGGETRLQPVYVRDVADAMVSTLLSKEPLGKTYSLGGPEVFTVKQLVELTYDTIREPYHSLPLPAGLAKAMAAPREFLNKKLPLPWNYYFTADYVDEMTQDNVVPSGEGVLTFADLNILPRKINEGIPIDQLRHLRVGGYDFGTTAGTISTGGAGFGGAAPGMGIYPGGDHPAK